MGAAATAGKMVRVCGRLQDACFCPVCAHVCHICHVFSAAAVDVLSLAWT